MIIPKIPNKQYSGKKVVIKRPMPDSQLNLFERWAFSETWEDLTVNEDINQMTNIFIEKVQHKVDETFPTKVVKIPINNKPWFNHKLRQLSAKKESYL